MLEAAVQKAVSDFMDTSPWYRGWWFHVPNERHERVHAVQLKREGVKRGVPDVLCIRPSGRFQGLAMELKRPKAPPSAVSREQREWLRLFGQCGWYVCVARGVDEALAHLDVYADPGRHPGHAPEV